MRRAGVGLVAVLAVALGLPVAAVAAVGTTVRRVPTEVPVVPNADEAREWLQRELADPVYHERRSLLQRLLDWLGSLFDGIKTLPIGGPGAVVVVVLLLALVVLVAFWIAGPVRRSRRAPRPTGGVLDGDDRRSADRLRADADAAAARGDWPAAVADRFRAVVRALEERAVLDERPGVTAHEAVEAAGARLPDLLDALRAAGRLFDDVVYGELAAGEQDDALMREVDRAVARARPTLTTTAVGAPGGTA
ncbi:MAG TPA: DUF4129 domain-containing protein [Cellulomonas sp.]